jgi:DNA-binding NarL/FixJ family response regulator
LWTSVERDEAGRVHLEAKTPELRRDEQCARSPTQPRECRARDAHPMAADRVKVLVVEPHPITVLGLRSVLQSDPDIELVETCSTGQQALTLLPRVCPALVLMDVTLPDMTGAELCRAIKSSTPLVEVLILTASEDNASVFGAVSAGASGYILKDITPDNLLRAIHAVRRGQTMVHPGIARRVLDKLSLITRNGNGGLMFDGKLTDREAEILVEVAKGLTNKEIAHKLFISESTVKSRLRGIFGKINAHDRAQATAYAIRGGYVR